jgi:hypothetical protein
MHHFPAIYLRQPISSDPGPGVRPEISNAMQPQARPMGFIQQGRLDALEHFNELLLLFLAQDA